MWRNITKWGCFYTRRRRGEWFDYYWVWNGWRGLHSQHILTRLQVTGIQPRSLIMVCVMIIKQHEPNLQLSLNLFQTRLDPLLWDLAWNVNEWAQSCWGVKTKGSRILSVCTMGDIYNTVDKNALVFQIAEAETASMLFQRIMFPSACWQRHTQT